MAAQGHKEEEGVSLLSTINEKEEKERVNGPSFTLKTKVNPTNNTKLVITKIMIFMSCMYARQK